MRKAFIHIVLLLAAYSATAQDSMCYYRLPIDGPLSLSANYGELRPNHFHGGIDIRVGGVVGMPVYAVAEGYVSRISVSPTGYGNAVYITHPNGTTSVYGHLHVFSPKIKTYIEKIQYARQRFAVDETLDEGVLPVLQGEQIGKAGNSGSSFGPHLHFELRDTPLQLPFDMFARGCFPIPADNIAPVFRNVSFFSFSQTADSLVCTAMFHTQLNPVQKVKQVVNVPDTFYIGIDVIDRQNGTVAKLAPNRVSVMLDGAIVFDCRLEDIGFDVSLCVNSAIAYEERIRSGNVLLKTYIEPGNKLAIYERAPDHGLITLHDTLSHTLEIKAIDDAGNATTTSFIICKRNYPAASNPRCDTAAWIPAYWNRENFISKNGVDVVIPQDALYQSIPMVIDTLTHRPPQALSPLWRIHTPETPLHRAIVVKIAAAIPDSLRSKALLAIANPKGGYYSAGGRWHDGVVETNVRSFGDFFVALDTVPPTIKPQFKNGENVSKLSQLKIKIGDNLSGVATYTAYIDNEWALFEYDAKNNVLIYNFDARRIKRGRKHELLITVTDNKQNTVSLQTWFVW